MVIGVGELTVQVEDVIINYGITAKIKNDEVWCMKLPYIQDTDVLVIGMGGAGTKAAIEAAKAGVDVTLCGKKKFATSGATFYPTLQNFGGMTAVTRRDMGDSEEQLLKEILSVGDGMVDENVAKVLVEGCTPAFRALEEEYGLPFLRDSDGNYATVVCCFGQHERGGSTPMPLFKKAMEDKLVETGVHLRENVDVAALVMHENRCCGAVAIDEKGELIYLRAKATVICTGGGCGIFKYSLATEDLTGDGYILALDAGASLVNMEFIQFIPGLTWPVEKFLFQQKGLDTMPELKNRFGEDFLAPYLPENVSREACLVERAKHGPFSTVGEGRFFDIAMYEEWRKGNAFDSGGLLLKYPESIRQDKRHYIVSMLNWLEEYGVDSIQKGFHLIPHAQGFNGGIHIKENAGTDIQGLYAAGEVAGGPHGADRLGGNALCASQVFGGIAGNQAAKYAQTMKMPNVDAEEAFQQMRRRLENQDGGIVDVEACMRCIRDIMWKDGAICRSEERCEEGLKEIARIEKTFDPMQHLSEDMDGRGAVSLYSYIQLAKVLLSVMNERKESRGPHYRLDYPEKDPKYGTYISVMKRDGEIVFRY